VCSFPPEWVRWVNLSSIFLTYLTNVVRPLVWTDPQRSLTLTADVSPRFLATTRGRVLACLRRGPATVEELASALDLTDNAIRAHLTSLDRDGLVRQAGVRRGPGAGKPAAIYELSADAELRFSRAYAPVLTALLEELSTRLSSEETEALMRDAGSRLAAGMPARATSLEERVREAAALLNALGGDVTLEAEPGGIRIRGSGCPLSAAVSRRPEACRAVQGLLAQAIGAPVVLCCDQGARPRCCFTVPTAA
jgi:predicted ArsR family transcriptional regulator